jgi:hypothetical protein
LRQLVFAYSFLSYGMSITNFKSYGMSITNFELYDMLITKN